MGFRKTTWQASQTGKNILHELIPLLLQSVYSRLEGYDDTNDADRLSQDPAMRVVVGWKGPDRKAASASEMGKFETESLTQKDNLKGLERLNVGVFMKALDSTWEIPVEPSEISCSDPQMKGVHSFYSFCPKNML